MSGTSGTRTGLRMLGSLLGVLPVVAIVALTVVVIEPSVAAPQRGQFPIDLQRTTIAALQEALTNRTISSRELVIAYQERIARFDTAGPRLTAVRMLDPTALAQAAQLDEERSRNRV